MFSFCSRLSKRSGTNRIEEKAVSKGSKYLEDYQAAVRGDDGLRLGPPVFEPEQFREHIADLDLTRAQQDELLRVIWDIAMRFVEMGFGVDSIHNLFPELFENPGTNEEQPLDSIGHETQQAIECVIAQVSERKE